MTKEMLERDWNAGLYQKSICRHWKGGDGTTVIYNDLGIKIPLGACESGKMLLDPGASIGPYTVKYQKTVWKVLAGQIEYRGNTYSPGAELTFQDESTVRVKNTYAGETIIGFTTYLQTYHN